MPWTYDDPPAVALNWTTEEQRRCVDAANEVLESGGTDEEAIYACISAAGKERGMKTKTFKAPIELKENGEEGEFRAVFSTFNVIDHDGDVTVPGAFEEGQKVRISYWGHRWQDLPVGRGEIHADDAKAWVDGKFFLDTQMGKETYLTVKHLDELQQWSYGFDVNEADWGTYQEQEVQFLRKLTVHEVSPVMLGAGIGTRTETIKSARKGGDSDTAGEDEDQSPGDRVESSGPKPQVVLTEIEIQLLEE